jgi:hypothetical protein
MFRTSPWYTPPQAHTKVGPKSTYGLAPHVEQAYMRVAFLLHFHPRLGLIRDLCLELQG